MYAPATRAVLAPQFRACGTGKILLWKFTKHAHNWLDYFFGPSSSAPSSYTSAPSKPSSVASSPVAPGLVFFVLAVFHQGTGFAIAGPFWLVVLAVFRQSTGASGSAAGAGAAAAGAGSVLHRQLSSGQKPTRQFFSQYASVVANCLMAPG